MIINNIVAVHNPGRPRRSLLHYILLILFIVPSCFADITASIDRNRISVDESFTLYIIDNSGTTRLNPQLQSLETDFQIIDSSTSNEIAILNGKTTATQQIIVTLMPKRSGHLIIPALSVGKDHTQALYIDVLPATTIPQNQKPLFIETSIESKITYPQTQTIYTVKLYYALSNLRGELSQPSVDNLQFILLKELNYQTKRGTKLYGVRERRYAIFADHEGTFVIPPLTFTGSTYTNTNGNVLFELTGGQPVRALSATTTLTVLPAINVTNWLPAQQLSLTETWSPNPPQFKVGEPVTRTLTLYANGLTAKQLPTITLAAINGVNNYPEQPIAKTITTDNGVTSTKVIKIAYIPTQVGPINFPEITLRWWNTQTKQFATATIPSQQFIVLASATAPTTQVAQSTVITTAPPKPTTSHVNFWKIIAGVLLLVWIITIYIFLKPKRQPKIKAAKLTLNELITNIKKACKKNSAFEISFMLIAWAQAQWPNATIQTLGEITKQNLHPQFKIELLKLDETLYHNETEKFDGNKMWHTFLLQQKITLSSEKQKLKQLPPLYKN